MKTETRTSLARQYGVHLSTFTGWLKDIPALKLSSQKRILTPKQVQIIYDELGEPPFKQSK